MTARRRARAARDDRRRRGPSRGLRQADGHGRRGRRAACGSRAGEGGAARRWASASSRTSALADTTRLQPFLRSSADTLDWTGRPHVDRVTITGPFNATGPGDTPSAPEDLRLPARAAPADEGACAKQIIATLARRAYRQPVKDADLQPMLDFYKSARRDGTFERGIERALQLILASPKFVFRVEQDPPNARARAASTASATSSWRRGSRSSSGAASRTKSCSTAAEPGQAEATARCSSGRCAGCWPIRSRAALVANFAGQWLQLRNLQNARCRIPTSFRISTTTCGRRSRARRSCSSRASCARTGTSSIC